jgi:RNA polymerase sigma factor (sigma-70 family)
LDDLVLGGNTAFADAIDLEQALEELSKLDSRAARIIELRFFGGLTVEEAAKALKLSTRTVELDWRMARAWLLRRLSEECPS